MSSILRRVRVYLGEGACEKNAAVILSSLKLYLCNKDIDIDYISPEETIEGIWKKSTLLYIIGGGYDLGFINALGDTGTQQIRDYVLEGGSYLGLCAGAYFASDHIEFGKDGPLEVCGERKLKFYPGISVGPVYGPYNYVTESGARAAKIKYNDHDMNTADVSIDAERSKQLDFKCYFNGGGMFLPYNAKKPIVYKKFENRNLCNFVNKETNFSNENSNASLEDIIDGKDRREDIHVELPYVLNVVDGDDEEWHQKGDISIKVQVLAYYEEISGSPASIVKCKVGRGMAVLSGPHIEYNSCNMNESNEYLKVVQNEIRDYDNEQNICFSSLLKHLLLL